MSATFFGYAASPVNGGSQSDASAPVSITPPASMAAGDFVYVVVSQRDTGVTLSNSNDGGQTWSAGDQVASGSQTTRAFWCQFDGTWDSNPAFTTSFAGGYDARFSVLMFVFRPSGSPTWAVDVAQTSGNSTPSTPFDVTATGHTATASGVTIACFFNTGYDGEVFALQSGGAGWSNPGSQSQFRNTRVSPSGSEMSVSLAYKLNSGAGATGDCTNRVTQSIATFWFVATFKDQSAATTTVTPGAGSATAAGQAPGKASSISVAPTVGLVVAALLQPTMFDGPHPSVGAAQLQGLAPTVLQTTPPSAALAPSVMVAAGQVPTLLRYRTITPQLNTTPSNGTSLAPTVIQGWLCQPSTGLAVVGTLIPNLLKNGAGSVTPISFAALSLGSLAPTLVQTNGNATVLQPSRAALEVSQLAPFMRGSLGSPIPMGSHQLVGLAPTLTQRVAWVDVGSPQDPVWRDV